MSLVLLCTKREKEKKKAQGKKLWPKSRKTAVEMWKKRGKRKRIRQREVWQPFSNEAYED